MAITNGTLIVLTIQANVWKHSRGELFGTMVYSEIDKDKYRQIDKQADTQIR